jgi:hypothetical protein
MVAMHQQAGGFFKTNGSNSTTARKGGEQASLVGEGQKNRPSHDAVPNRSLRKSCRLLSNQALVNIFTCQQIKIMETVEQRALVLL